MHIKKPVLYSLAQQQWRNPNLSMFVGLPKEMRVLIQ